MFGLARLVLPLRFPDLLMDQCKSNDCPDDVVQELGARARSGLASAGVARSQNQTNPKVARANALTREPRVDCRPSVATSPAGPHDVCITDQQPNEPEKDRQNNAL
jgi:hypothetical protein